MAELRVGECAEVETILLEEGMGRRVRELGLQEGAVVTCVGESPLGDPHAYQVGRTVLALRQQDARSVRVRAVA